MWLYLIFFNYDFFFLTPDNPIKPIIPAVAPRIAAALSFFSPVCGSSASGVCSFLTTAAAVGTVLSSFSGVLLPLAVGAFGACGAGAGLSGSSGFSPCGAGAGVSGSFGVTGTSSPCGVGADVSGVVGVLGSFGVTGIFGVPQA